MKTFNNSTYRSLPKGVTIKESTIDGLGLHATKDLSAGTILGVLLQYIIEIDTNGYAFGFSKPKMTQIVTLQQIEETELYIL